MIGEDRALVARLADEERRRNGIPSEEDAAARERAVALAEAALGDALHADGLRTSVLGPGWSSDVDAHCAVMPDPGALMDRGWLPLDGLAQRLGHDATDQWAIVEEGEILGVLDLQGTPAPDPLASLLARCRRRGEVRVREVLELRALLRAGRELPRDAVVRLAARVEAHLGGDDLAAFRGGEETASPPARLPERDPRAALRRWVWRIGHGRRRFIVAISGVDGAGKSTLAASLRRSLRRAGFPVAVAWTRPGMRLGWLGTAARAAKRLAGRPAEPGVYRVGAGDPSEDLPARRGVVGWLWSLAVTLAFVRDARRRARRGGVVLFDRHLLDALATLDLVYGGVRLGVHRALVRRLLPRADVTLYLDVPAEAALDRKADDLFGESAVRRQLVSYERWAPTLPGAVRIGAARPLPEVTRSALRGILTER